MVSSHQNKIGIEIQTYLKLKPGTELKEYTYIYAELKILHTAIFDGLSSNCKIEPV